MGVHNIELYLNENWDLVTYEMTAEEMWFCIGLSIHCGQLCIVTYQYLPSIRQL